jgi:hypothetical protein
MAGLRRLVVWMVSGLLLTTATLTCCVLPSLLVLLGAGSAVASLVQLLPGVVLLSEHARWVFGLAGALLLFNSLQLRRQRRSACPADPALARRCQRARAWARVLHQIALALYGVALLVTFVLPRLLGL